MDRREIRWLDAARRDFLAFPDEARSAFHADLECLARGGKPPKAKPMKGFGAGVLEIAQRQGGNAWRLIYALKIGNEIWMIHAFQKKSKSGIATPQKDIETIRARLKQVRTAR